MGIATVRGARTLCTHRDDIIVLTQQWFGFGRKNGRSTVARKNGRFTVALARVRLFRPFLIRTGARWLLVITVFGCRVIIYTPLK